MASLVYYGSAKQAQLEARESLPAKLDLIIEKLQIRDRVNGETVLIKLHVGNNIGYSTVHPVFVRKVVQAVRDGGGKPYIADVDWDVRGSEMRGYTPEVLGCPIYPVGGPADRYFYRHEFAYKGIREWKIAGLVEDASFLINFAHAKGHPSCSYGGAFKNLALGCMVGETRSAMHDVCHFDPYWFQENCPDNDTLLKIIASCPQSALVEDKKQSGMIHLHVEQCNQCGRCLQIAPPGSLKIDPINFESFQEACAISTSLVLATFAPQKAVHLCLATHMTPVCDCYGFTSMPILPDAGIFGSDDIVALDQAVLDSTAKTPLIEENLPTCMEVVTRNGHPLSWMHGKMKDPYLVVKYGERLGLGSQQYEIVDVLPVEKKAETPVGYISAR